MGDWEILYLAFVVLLGLESLAWRRKGEIFFARSPWGGWRLSLNVLVIRPLLLRIPHLRLGLPAGQRFNIIEFSTRIHQARSALALWRWMSGLLAAWIYFALPFIYLTWPAPAMLGLGMLIMLLLWQITAFCLWFGKRRLGSQGNVLSAFLTPISALRGSDLVSLKLAEGFHPLAVAQVLLKPADFEALALLAWRSHCLGWHKAQFWPQEQLQGEAWVDWLKKQSLNLDKALAQPEAQSGAQVWCPRCHAQYREPFDICVDCEAKLSPFK